MDVTAPAKQPAGQARLYLAELAAELTRSGWKDELHDADDPEVAIRTRPTEATHVTGDAA